MQVLDDAPLVGVGDSLDVDRDVHEDRKTFFQLNVVQSIEPFSVYNEYLLDPWHKTSGISLDLVTERISPSVDSLDEN